jgi:hypothetical protein
MSKRYDPRAAVAYMAERGVKRTTGTLEVFRCQKKGPEYIRIGGRIYYTEEALDAYLAGEPVKTVG